MFAAVRRRSPWCRQWNRDELWFGELCRAWFQDYSNPKSAECWQQLVKYRDRLRRTNEQPIGRNVRSECFPSRCGSSSSTDPWLIRRMEQHAHSSNQLRCLKKLQLQETDSLIDLSKFLRLHKEIDKTLARMRNNFIPYDFAVSLSNVDQTMPLFTLEIGKNFLSYQKKIGRW